ncbi:MAG: LacI family DNA-binding transcriptional regulator [Candidatus Humimicrobiaceae bacterium]|jgi:LacI family transcriptional regulator|nr:LacI family DNA-binding transcriptional regulator [Actinomycetota bacterium]MDY0027432.1 LacI family DNA-binding transcriptional regulator [Candidatus Humimicrobiaceae bacterium]
MVNYNDIAKLAKVSPTTVSHVINETRFVMPETKERVYKAMRELKYQPNLLARSLATGKTQTVGLVISDIRNPFYPELVQGVEEMAVKNDYNVFLCNTDYDIEKGVKSIGALIKRKIDGIIVASSQVDNSILKQLTDTDVNFVLVDWCKRNIKVDSLYFDYKVGIAEAVSHLVSVGHRDIYFIGGPKNLKTAEIRIRNFIDIMESYKDLRLNYKILEGNHKIDGGYEAARKMLKNKDLPTAVMCSNDLTAIGAMKAFQSGGLEIPEDISIIGLDNIALTEIVSPELTTIELERYKIGKTAMEMLLNRIKDKKLPRQICTFKTKLIVRKSTAENKKN